MRFTRETSRTDPEFWRHYRRLPVEVRRLASEKYAHFLVDPKAARFKCVVPGDPPVYSVRVNLRYRALGTLTGDIMLWYWIGTHEEYDRILAKARSGQWP